MTASTEKRHATSGGKDFGVDLAIYVQHLLGVGHLTRAAAIARACDAAGLSTVLISGGPPLAALPLGGAALLQLPPLKSRDAAFSALVEAGPGAGPGAGPEGSGREIDEAFKARRRAALLGHFEELRPRVLMIELYPFGRRMLRFELEPLVAAARARRPRPWLLCSLRDLLNPPEPEATPKQAEKSDWALARVREAFDRVLVHGDPDLAPLEASFPRAGEIAERLVYTGYVLAEPPAAPTKTAEPDVSEPEVLVSTGGGAVGAALVEAALAARPLSPLAAAPWRILVGASLDETRFGKLRAAAPEGVAVERARPDFQALLGRARLSISQGGYNTVMEVLQAGPPAVVVPFETPGEGEQRLRAALLAERGLLTLLPAERLTPESLAGAIAEALAREASRGTGPPALRIDTGGAANTAGIVAGLAAIVPD